MAQEQAKDFYTIISEMRRQEWLAGLRLKIAEWKVNRPHVPMIDGLAKLKQAEERLKST